MFLDKPGLQIGMHQGYTQFNDTGLNYYFRLYNKHSFRPDRFGEFSISSGIISGLGYRSQLTPVEYRFGEHLSRLFNSPEPSLFGKRSNLFVYVGAGVLYSKPLEVVAPEDPLTQEMGNALPTSSFWDFKGGLAPFIPIGFGIELPLEAGASLNLSAGYNQTLSMLKFNSYDVPKSYWGLSIGIDFERSKPEPKPYIPPTMYSIQSVPLPPAQLKPQETNNMVIAKLNNRNVQFDLLSSNISSEDREWIGLVSQVFEFSADAPLMMYGHASATGTDAVNQMISESRARAVWLAFVEAGVDYRSMDYSWYGDSRPVAENETDEGRAKNRRVLFTQRDSAITVQSMEPVDAEIPFEIAKPLYLTRYFSFDWLKFQNPEVSYHRLKETASLLEQNEGLSLYIATINAEGYERPIYRELDKARAEKIKADLIHFGITPDRIETFNPYTESLPIFVEKELNPNYPQRTALVPHYGFRIQLGVFGKKENVREFEDRFSEQLAMKFTVESNEAGKTYTILTPVYHKVSQAVKKLKEIQNIPGFEDAFLVPVTKNSNNE